MIALAKTRKNVASKKYILFNEIKLSNICELSLKTNNLKVKKIKKNEALHIRNIAFNGPYRGLIQ